MKNWSVRFAWMKGSRSFLNAPTAFAYRVLGIGNITSKHEDLVNVDLIVGVDNKNPAQRVGLS